MEAKSNSYDCHEECFYGDEHIPNLTLNTGSTFVHIRHQLTRQTRESGDVCQGIERKGSRGVRN